MPIKKKRNIPHNARAEIVTNRNKTFTPFINSVPLDIQQQNELANEFAAWIVNNDVVCLDEFPLAKLYSPYEFFQMRDNNPYCARVFDFARRRMGQRLKKAWKYKQEGIDTNFVIKMLPIYDDEYRQYCLERTKVQSEGKAMGAFKIVSLPPVADCPEVKSRIKKGHV